MRRAFTKQFKNEVLDRIKRGETRVSVSKAMRVSLNTITKWTQEAGIAEPNSLGYSPEFVQRVLSDIRNGTTIREASKKHNVSNRSISRWIEEEKIAKNCRKTVPLVTAPVSSPKKALEVILDDRLYTDKQVQISLTDDNKLLFRIMSR